MFNSNLIKSAHKMAKEIKAEFPNVDYKLQFGLCMSYLLDGGKMEATRENNSTLNKVITAIENLDEVKFNKIYAEKVIAEATKMFNDGWEALANGTVVTYKNNQVITKDGNLVVNNEMAEFSIKSGKVEGNIVREISKKEVPEDKKENYLGQAIIAKYYTLRRA